MWRKSSLVKLVLTTFFEWLFGQVQNPSAEAWAVRGEGALLFVFFGLQRDLLFREVYGCTSIYKKNVLKLHNHI